MIMLGGKRHAIVSYMRQKGYTYEDIGYLLGGLSKQTIQQSGKSHRIRVQYRKTITTVPVVVYKVAGDYSEGTEEWLTNNFNPVDKSLRLC